VRPIIGRLTRDNWAAHVSLVLAATAAAAVLASHAEGELAGKVITAVLWVLAVMLIVQNLVERSSGGRVSYGMPYALCAGASIIMLAGQSMTSGPIVTVTAEVSGILFAIGIIWLAFQVQGLLRSPQQ
jgi:predicted membrane channel-forming protein YqfA (hemolysin III family)